MLLLEAKLFSPLLLDLLKTLNLQPLLLFSSLPTALVLLSSPPPFFQRVLLYPISLV